MEEQDKFNQPSGNEPMKQSFEQPTDTDCESTADETTQSTPDETEDAEVDAEIIWDSKRPGCLDLKYYRKYWQDTVSVAIFGFFLFFMIIGNIGYFIEEGFDRGAMLVWIRVMSVILPLAVLMQMTRNAFRRRKPEALFLRVAQSVYTVLFFSTVFGMMLYHFKDEVVSAESGKLDFGLFAIEYSKTASCITSLLYQTIFWLFFIVASVGGLLECTHMCTDKELKSVFPSDNYMDTSKRGFWTVIGIMSLPIIVHIVLTIIAFG